MEREISIRELRHAARDVGETTGARLVVLFGSVARGHDVPSDLDIGVLAGPPGETVDTVDLTNRLTRSLDVAEVDVTDLGRADPLLCMLAARDGVPLYERSPGAFHGFVSLSVRRYADTRKFRAMERRRIREFVDRAEVRS